MKNCLMRQQEMASAIKLLVKESGWQLVSHFQTMKQSNQLPATRIATEK